MFAAGHEVNEQHANGDLRHGRTMGRRHNVHIRMRGRKLRRGVRSWIHDELLRVHKFRDRDVRLERSMGYLLG